MTTVRTLTGTAATWLAAGILLIAAKVLGRESPLGVIARDAGRGLTRVRPADAA